MVDALASGVSGSNPVEVQVLSSAPKDISIVFTKLANGSFQIAEKVILSFIRRFKNNICAIRSFSIAEPALILSVADFIRFKNCSLVSFISLRLPDCPGCQGFRIGYFLLYMGLSLIITKVVICIC